MPVLLLSTYDLGRQPFGLASPAAWLKRAGIDVAAVDLSRDKLSDAAIAGATLVAFCFLTAMHERYSYGALVFLMLLLPDRRMRWLGLGFGIVFTLNVLAAVPPTPEIAGLLPVTSPERIFFGVSTLDLLILVALV